MHGRTSCCVRSDTAGRGVRRGATTLTTLVGEWFIHSLWHTPLSEPLVLVLFLRLCAYRSVYCRTYVVLHMLHGVWGNAHGSVCVVLGVWRHVYGGVSTVWGVWCTAAWCSVQGAACDVQ